MYFWQLSIDFNLTVQKSMTIYYYINSENKIIEKVILPKIYISPKVVYMTYSAMNRMYT